MISAKIIADSKNEFGDRITTMEIVIPRIVLAEFNTHRMFSRNSASSRAIPFKRMVKMVQENPFIPIAWQKEHTGMQGTEYLTSGIGDVEDTWLRARDNAVQEATILTQRGVTKQLANRLLEPFMYHKVIVTATEWENFFKLRCPQYKYDDKIYRSFKDLYSENEGHVEEWVNINLKSKWDEFKKVINKSQAEIHIQAVAEAMWDAMNESTPKLLQRGEWHIPYGEDIDQIDVLDTITNPEGELDDSAFDEERHRLWSLDLIKIATARCARVSYTTVGDDGKVIIDDYTKDIQLHDRLATSGHWSPFEHCARVMSQREHMNMYISRGEVTGNKIHQSKGWCANFRGFIQYRYLAEKNNK